jgi:HNH endonuclease/AP2 domain
MPIANMKNIELTQGQIALVDDDEFEVLSQTKWYARWNKITQSFYALRNARRDDGSRYKIYMHRQIAGDISGMDVDHVNHNTLDNRGVNLRLCTRAQNGANYRRVRSNSTSGYRGVSWHKLLQKWRAYIYVYGKQFNLGYFDDIADAVAARSVAARKYHGEFAVMDEFQLAV